jgi:general secretion pathway protein F
MTRFRYDALEPDGRAVTGTIDAMDEVQALELISNKGLTPVDLQQGSQKAPWWSRELSFSGASSVKARDLESFLESFATLLSANLPLPRALAFCEGQTRNYELMQAISEIRSDLENGRTLAVSLEAQNGIIPERIRVILRLGESSNTLPLAVNRAAEMLRLEAELRRELKSAMIYPIILLFMSLLVLALVIFYLAPTLAPVFATAGAEPPYVLLAMTGIRDFVVGNFMIALGATVVTVLLLFLLRVQINTLLVMLVSYVPAISRYQEERETLRFCQSLTLMLTAGASLPEAINSAEQATSSSQWKSAILQARLEVESGGRLSQSLEDFEAFDPMTLSLLRAGEESDNVVEMLSSATRSLQNNTKASLQRALRLLTPALTLVIGGLVGLLIISTISAILDLNDIAF